MGAHRFRVLLFHVVAALLAMGLALATGAPSHAVTPPTFVGTATITGHIYLPDGVTPYTGGGSLSVYHFYNGSWQDIGGYTTNAPGDDGSFAITGVGLLSSPEDLRIGLGPTGGYDAQYYHGSFTLDGATSVPVTKNQVASGIDFTLARNPSYGTISGTVTDTSGNPVSVPVKIYPDDTSVTPMVVISDAATGAWSERVPGGATYTVSFSENLSDGWATRWYLDTDAVSATHVPVPAGGAATGIDAHLVADANAATIGGTLTGPGGAPASGVDVRITDVTHGDESFGTTSQPDGTWTATVQGGDTYRLTFSESKDDLFVAQEWNGGQTFTPAAGSTTLTYDARLAPVPVVDVTRPQISGLPFTGHTLTATAGTWSPADATAHYQWLADGRPIARATTSRLKLGRAEVGHRVSVRVTATKTGYASASATSARTRIVKAVPHISIGFGHASRGRTLLRVAVRAIVPVTGQVQVQAGHRLLGTGRLVDGRHDFVVRLARGARVKVRYFGSRTVAAATATRRFAG